MTNEVQKADYSGKPEATETVQPFTSEPPAILDPKQKTSKNKKNEN